MIYLDQDGTLVFDILMDEQENGIQHADLFTTGEGRLKLRHLPIDEYIQRSIKLDSSDFGELLRLYYRELSKA